MKIHLTFIIGFCCLSNSFSQIEGNREPFPDTLYFPFYNGVQMIEIDHLTYYEMLDMRYSTMDQMPYFDHRPFANEYFFRDKTGKIVKSFNSSLDHDTLETKLRNVSFINRASHYTNYQNSFKGFGYWYEINSKEKEQIYYSIFDHNFQDYFDRDTSTLRKGLIDTLGNVLFQPEFEELIPLKKRIFLASQNLQFGIITLDKTILVPFKYFRPDYSNKNILFFNDHESVKMGFDLQTEHVIEVPFHKYQFFFQVPQLFVTEHNELLGVWDVLKNQQIIPNQYDYLNVMTYYGKPNELAIIVGRNKKYGLFTTTGKEMLPCDFDEIGRWQEIDGQLVLKVVKNGIVTEIKATK